MSTKTTAQWGAPRKTDKKNKGTKKNAAPARMAVATTNPFGALHDDSASSSSGDDACAFGFDFTGVADGDLEKAVFSNPPLQAGVAWADQVGR